MLEQLASGCHIDRQQVLDDTKIPQPNITLNNQHQTYLFMINFNEVAKTQVRKNIKNKQFKVKEMQMWNQVKKKCIQLQEKDLVDSEQMRKILVEGVQNIETRNKQMRNRVNEKTLRKDKLAQFSQSTFIHQLEDCQNQSKIATANKSIYLKKAFTPYGSQKKAEQHVISFNPEQKQISFRVQTFEGKTVQFILFFDQAQQKYGLKNSLKIFKSADIVAVKNFNVHQSRPRLLQELKAIVTNYIDNAAE